MSSAKVFIIAHSPRFDYSSAEEFGEPVYIFADREVTPFKVDEVLRRIGRKLTQEGYDEARDFIAITGPSALLALFLAFVGGLRVPARLLMFDASIGKYRERVLATSQTA